MTTDDHVRARPAGVRRVRRRRHRRRGHHGATDKQYILIALILAAITAAEVTLSYIDIGPLFLPALLILMVIKFFIVVSYFMHLKFDNKIFSCMFYLGLVPGVVRLLVALSTFHFFST